jgi:hypothetical protein
MPAKRAVVARLTGMLLALSLAALINFRNRAEI